MFYELEICSLHFLPFALFAEQKECEEEDMTPSVQKQKHEAADFLEYSSYIKCIYFFKA